MPRILFGLLNFLAFAPLLGIPLVTAIAYANPDLARDTNLGLLGFAFAPLTLITALSVPVNLGGMIYFGIHRRDRPLSIVLLLAIIILVLTLVAYNSFGGL